MCIRGPVLRAERPATMMAEDSGVTGSLGIARNRRGATRWALAGLLHDAISALRHGRLEKRVCIHPGAP